jgi:glycosyltransferase involved in cell wall biosynthesis
MKIAIIAQGSIPAQTANSIQNMKMAGAVAELGNEVKVFAPGKNIGAGWDKLANHYGLAKQFEIQWLPKHDLFRRYDFALKAVRASQEWSADLIYTRLPQAATWAAAHGVPTIFELHDLPSGNMGPWLLRRFIRSLGAKRLVVNTNHLEIEIQKRYRIPEGKDFLILAPNGVDLQRYENLPDPKTARQKLRLPENFTAGYTGHLYKGRGIELILGLARRMPEIRFLFVGGREDDLAQRRQQAVGLANVQFIGFVPNAELPLYQAACDVFLMPHEQKVSGSSGADITEFTNPLKMFEYLACGRPILASDLTILREVLNKNNAILLPIADIQAWTDTLAALSQDSARRADLAQAGKKTAAQFSWQNRAARILRDIEKTAKI